MSHFIETSTGVFVNTDFIRKIVVPRGKDADTEYHLSNKEILYGPGHYNDPRNIKKIIPAAASVFAFLIFKSDCPDGVWINREPIIGWRDLEGYCEAVFRQDPGEAALKVIEAPDGKFYELEYDGSIFESLEEAKQYARDNKP